jgi:hypothetical protein
MPDREERVPGMLDTAEALVGPAPRVFACSTWRAARAAVALVFATVVRGLRGGKGVSAEVRVFAAVRVSAAIRSIGSRVPARSGCRPGSDTRSSWPVVIASVRVDCESSHYVDGAGGDGYWC